ncbi:cadmium resistance transporter [Companilactobacillus futsaii]|uniref:cadmium resistance transporter n=1 Tax=Companilactobacillus futsaii TaxID=938155 RepID=UPI00189F11A8|nr:cadmium resistance transporter [Companilactobacillus futsaii]
MNYWLLLLTFLSVNLDFFFILIFLLEKFRLPKVILGYLLGNIILLSISFTIGKTLATFLPEWILGVLGILPIYLALHDDDDDSKHSDNKSEVLNVLITYLSVCAGCNLSIFLPVLAGENLNNFIITLLFIGSLTILIVLIIKLISKSSLVKIVMKKYGEIAMKICYVSIGLYVFWDSGLITHLLGLL